MRLIKDFRDWLGLRRHIVGAWRFVRTRREPIDAPTRQIRFRDGASMTLRTAEDDRHIFLNIFGRDEYRLAELEPRGMDTVIDVGAHVGIFATRAASFCRRVLSYEPSPATYRLLLENVSRLANVTPIPKAVTDRRATAQIHLFPEPSGNSIYPAKPEHAVDSISVDTIALADVFAEHGVESCDLLKLDCEGAEYPIIFGAPRELWSRIARVAMEYHSVKGAQASWSGEGLARYLAEVGHTVRLLPRGHHPGKGLLFSARSPTAWSAAPDLAR